MDTSGLITIKEVVHDILSERGEYSQKDFIRLSRMVERGLTKLNLFVLGTVSTAKIEIDQSSKSAPLPSDFVRRGRIGIVLPNGRLYTMTNDEYRALGTELECGIDTTQNTESVRRSIGGTYSDSGGQSSEGSYRINKKMNRIEFGQDVKASHVVMEYSSSGVNADGNTFVPVDALEALMAWCEWKSTPRANAGIRDRAKQDFYEEALSLSELQAPTFGELYDTILANYTQVATR